jgi:hypothetical protein
MGRTACTEPQCLYKDALYLYLTVELYLYSPYGPYGLYRALVPVQGCTLYFFTLYHIVEYARNILAVNQSLSQAFTITELLAVKLNLSFCRLFE